MLLTKTALLSVLVNRSAKHEMTGQTSGMHLSSMETPGQPMLRRTRFVCISDTHNSRFKLPPGDVLIHAGDLTNQGSYSEVR